MATPFLFTGNEGSYESRVWSGLRLLRGERYILLESPDRLDGMGSAVYGGGVGQVERMINIYVDRFYRCDDPERDIAEGLGQWGIPAVHTAGLLTAVQLRHVSVQEEHTGDYAVLCCATAGVSNAARAGSQRTTFRADWTPGTINVMLAVDGRMTQAAMVNAIMTATEAKVAALHDLGVCDAENGLPATGTTTDAIVLGVSQRPEWALLHSYAGTATDLGGTVGRLVYAAVSESLRVAAAERP